MAPAPYTSYMAFLDPENKSWAPGQVLIITETTGDTACPVYAVHHNYTWYNPATRNLFVRKEANAAARALKVRECFCVGPQQFYHIKEPCLDESIPAYVQDDTESEFFGKFPLGYHVDVDQLQVKPGILASSFPTFYYDKLPGLLDQFCRVIDLKHGFPGDLGFVYAKTSFYTEPDYTYLYYDCNTGDFLGEDTVLCEVGGEGETSCRAAVTISARFIPCEEDDGVNDPINENFGLFVIEVNILNCQNEGAEIAPSQRTRGVYHAWRKTEPRINLLEPVVLTKTQDYSEIYLNSEDYASYTNEQSPIDWPETLTLTPVY